MGILTKLVDSTLLLVFGIIAIGAPLIDSQTFLPENMFPEMLVDLKKFYVEHYDDYLMEEKPHFFVGLVWFELLFQWPLVVLCVYGMLASKQWFKTTCLIYGVSLVTSMAAILGELVGSKRASNKFMMMYSPFMAFGVLAILRGLLPPTTTSSASPHSIASRKKKA